MEPVPGSDASQEFIRTQLDEILAREIVAFIDVDSDAAMMTFNLATISCITIIVEREREIRQFADFPPERYDLEAFTSELVDIGLDNDDYLNNAINGALKSGYISSDDNGELKAEMAAFMMAGMLDSMFPGMQGLNLIAFVLQMHHEVDSGRKSLELAKQSFATSLKTRGVSVTQDSAQKLANEMASGKAKVVTVQSKEISTKLKKENLNRLSKLIKTRKKRTGEYKERVKVQDLFDKGPTKEELEAEKREIQQAEEAARKAAELAKQLAEKEEKIKEAEEAASELEQQLKDLEEKEKKLAVAEEEAKLAKQKAAELEAREAEMAEKEARLKALEEQIRLKEEEAKRREEEQVKETTKPSGDEDDIESRIAAFEMELAMPCPICAEGKVAEKTTEKGKAFFSCNQEDCRFVSWDKPYHFQCPLCKNPYLVEVDLPNGGKGLKCPRAACSYTQDNLLEPSQHMAAAAEAAKPKKKKKIVRRRKRR
ncbi:MAG: topoisomerase DNA-binding C4 zinc finger domain-containing protein [Desulfobacterales bacterium]|nr:topoisomerase DNA-binding C4 zinc finger domain-containing protein [Desulfobacterales bacterium]